MRHPREVHWTLAIAGRSPGRAPRGGMGSAVRGGIPAAAEQGSAISPGPAFDLQNSQYFLVIGQETPWAWVEQ